MLFGFLDTGPTATNAPPAVPEQAKAELFATVVAEILARLPQSNDAAANAEARGMAVALAGEIVASSRRDGNFSVNSAISAAVTTITTKVYERVEAVKAIQGAASATAASATVIRTRGLRVFHDGGYNEITASDEELALLRREAEIILAREQLLETMRLIEINGAVFVQMPITLTDGSIRLVAVPIENFQRIELSPPPSPEGRYTISLYSMGVFRALPEAEEPSILVPIFRRQELEFTPLQLQRVLGVGKSPQEMLEMLRNQENLLQRLIRAHEDEQRLHEDAPPQTMAGIDIPSLPPRGFAPTELPASLIAASRIPELMSA